MKTQLLILAGLLALGLLASGRFLDDAASGAPIQQFDTSGAFEVDVNWCYGGSYPVSDGAGGVLCGPGSSSTTTPRDTALDTYSIISRPIGTRFGASSIFTPNDGPSEWQVVAPICGGLDANNECTAATVTGDVTARLDLQCSNGADDILGGAGGTGGDPATEWPKKDPDGGGAGTGWNNVDFVRTSAASFYGGGGAPTGGANAYVPGIAPFPSSAPNAFTFGSIDTSILTQVYLAGTAPFALPAAVRLQLFSSFSSYASQSSSPGTGEGLGVSTSLLGGSPDNPPSDGFTCLDSPQDSVATTTYLKTPDADRVIPRWTFIASAADIDDGTQQVLLDWQCVTVGAGEADADGDCDPDATDTDDANKDIDGDLLPDGIESFLGSSPTSANSDGDAADDFEEMVNFTDPADADSDDDLQLDKKDLTPTNGTETADASDATDDNCPAIANADKDGVAGGPQDGDPSRPGDQVSQLNTDSLYLHHGHTQNADGSVASPATGDKSNPDEDIDGDACDDDDDNDQMPDATEASFTIVPWSGTSDPGGSGDAADSAACASPGTAGSSSPLVPPGHSSWAADGPWDGDMDADLVLDGRECQFRARPDLALRATASCGTVPVDPDGCAQPNNGAGGGAIDDPDGDLLFLKGGSHTTVETALRTMGINVCRATDSEPPCPVGLSTTGQDNDVDNDGLAGNLDRDSDRDYCDSSVGCSRPATPSTAALVQDGPEVLFYGTGPSSFDTDRDGCPDAEEISDHSGDFRTTAGDQLLFVIAKNAAPALGKLDPDADGDVDNYHLANKDLNKNKTLDAGDQLIMAAIIAAPGACATTEGAVVIGKLAKNLP